MTDPQILRRAVNKARANGWVGDGNTFEVRYIDSDYFNSTDVLAIIWPDASGEDKFDQVTIASELIYNHEFAKALWPGELNFKIINEPDKPFVTAWIYHLQQMVIADNPIQYLGGNI